ncbi:MAG: hypothetical protein KDB23_08620 [Planctomycetales bacterium]|nr:hypothetical protein [Planctomycetales bacterium]
MKPSTLRQSIQITWYLAYLALCSLSVGASVARGHMIWITTQQSDSPAKATLKVHFGERPEDCAYKLPEFLRHVPVHIWRNGDAHQLSLTAVETPEFLGLESGKLTSATMGIATLRCEYGVYHGTRLNFTAKHYAVEALGEPLPPVSRVGFELQVHEIGPKRIRLITTLDGQPTVGAKVSWRSGSRAAESTVTNERGIAEIDRLENGLQSAWAQWSIAKSGSLGEETYETETYVATVTIEHAPGVAPEVAQRPPVVSNVPDLPQAIASFGATVCDGYLYVLGGHIGEAHQHSRNNIANYFGRVRLAESSAWEQLPYDGIPTQGLALVSVGSSVYRIGGMAARNAPGDAEDLHSTTDFANFDPTNGSWTPLPPLPAGRSSHDAIAIGNCIYVLGGWNLQGSSPGEWHRTGLCFNVSSATPSWQSFELPCEKRAIAAAAYNGQLMMLGGMTTDESISRSVHIYDPQSRQWHDGPVFPGSGMNGFGMAAVGGSRGLIASAADGEVYRLNATGDGWTPVAKLTHPAFFHRLVQAPAGRYLAIGGASKDGHLSRIERITLE